MNVLAGTEKTGRGSAYLESSAGPVAGLRFTIQTLPLRIGRGPQVALSLEADQGVSRQHAEIYESAGRLRIRDLQSTHGTFVNGRRITDESLSSGDQISLGLSTLVFTMEDRDAST
jgi:pSer/pThr/pTyr-binding forkhead associated (FHA) protein